MAAIHLTSTKNRGLWETSGGETALLTAVSPYAHAQKSLLNLNIFAQSNWNQNRWAFGHRWPKTGRLWGRDYLIRDKLHWLEKVTDIQLFRRRLSHESVKAYATVPIGIMGSKNLALLDWASRRLSNKEREKMNTCLCCFLPPRWNTFRFTQASVKTIITHNNFRHYRVSFSLFVRQPFSKQLYKETRLMRWTNRIEMTIRSEKQWPGKITLVDYISIKRLI